MPDESLDILVKTTGDPAAAAAVGAALDDVNKKTSQGTEKNEEHGRSFAHAESSGKAFHHLLHTITEGSEEAGLALRAMLGPVGAAIGGAALILRHFNQEIEESKKHAAELAAAFAKPFGDMRTSIAAARQEVAMLQIDYDNWAKSVTEHSGEISKATTQAITDLHTRTEAVKELAKAQLDAAKAQVQASIMPEDEKRVKLAGLDRSAMALESKTDREARAAEVKIVADQLAAAETKRHAAAKAVQDAEANAKAVKGRAKGQDLPKEIESLKEIVTLHEAEYQRLQAIADKLRDMQPSLAHPIISAEMLMAVAGQTAQGQAPHRPQERINAAQEAAQAEADLAASNRKKLEKLTSDQAAYEQAAKVAALTVADKQAKSKDLEETVRELQEHKKSLDAQNAIRAQFQPAIDAAKAAAANAKLLTEIQSGNTAFGNLEKAAEVAHASGINRLPPALQAVMVQVASVVDKHVTGSQQAADTIAKMAGSLEGQKQLWAAVAGLINQFRSEQNAFAQQLVSWARFSMIP